MLEILKQLINNQIPLCKIYVSDTEIAVKNCLAVDMGRGILLIDESFMDVCDGMYSFDYIESIKEMVDNLCIEYVNRVRNNKIIL